MENVVERPTAADPGQNLEISPAGACLGQAHQPKSSASRGLRKMSMFGQSAWAEFFVN